MRFRAFASVVTSPSSLTVHCYAFSSCLSLLSSTMYALFLRSLLFGSLVSYCALWFLYFSIASLVCASALCFFLVHWYLSLPLGTCFVSLSLPCPWWSFILRLLFLLLPRSDLRFPPRRGLPLDRVRSVSCFVSSFFFRYFFGSLSVASLSCSSIISPLHSLAVVVPPPLGWFLRCVSWALSHLVPLPW